MSKGKTLTLTLSAKALEALQDVLMDLVGATLRVADRPARTEKHGCVEYVDRVAGDVANRLLDWSTKAHTCGPVELSITPVAAKHFLEALAGLLAIRHSYSHGRWVEFQIGGRAAAGQITRCADDEGKVQVMTDAGDEYELDLVGARPLPGRRLHNLRHAAPVTA